MDRVGPQRHKKEEEEEEEVGLYRRLFSYHNVSFYARVLIFVIKNTLFINYSLRGNTVGIETCCGL